MQAEIAAKRAERLLDAATRPAIERPAIPPYPDRLMFLSLFDGSKKIFAIRSTPRKIEMLARRFVDLLADARSHRECPCSHATDAYLAHVVALAQDMPIGLRRSAVAWLIRDDVAMWACLFDPLVDGVGFQIEGKNLGFLEHRAAGRKESA